MTNTKQSSTSKPPTLALNLTLFSIRCLPLTQVRTNSKELIDVRPAFGALYRSSDDEAIASLSIRYKGDS